MTSAKPRQIIAASESVAGKRTDLESIERIRNMSVNVLAQREMEKGRSPLVWIPPLRGGDFQGIGVYRPMTVSTECTAREDKLPRC